jgi:DNA-binding NarL/FixJ family response regulator
MPAASRRPVLLTVDDNRVIHEVYALAFEKDLHAPASPRRPGGTGHRALRDRRRGDPRPRHAGPQRPRSARSSAQAEARADGRHRLGHRYVSECAPGSATGVVRQLLAARADPTVAIPQPALVAHRVLLVSLDPGFRAALTVALQPRCRVDSAPRIGVAVEMLRSMMPDLGVVDLRGASRERAADLESLRSSFPEGPTIVVGAADRLGPLLHPSAGRVEALVTEPVDFGELFAEIASLLPPSRAGIPTKRLSPPTSVAVRRVTEQYQDHTFTGRASERRRGPLGGSLRPRLQRRYGNPADGIRRSRARPGRDLPAPREPRQGEHHRATARFLRRAPPTCRGIACIR